MSLMRDEISVTLVMCRRGYYKPTGLMRAVNADYELGRIDLLNEVLLIHVPWE
jgi:hypothetical protein